MNDIIPIKDFKKIDLCENAIIEAGAGTGKTYTIENLVVELLLNDKAKITEIVVVTFTEKAIGELKDRIRKNFFDKLNQDNNRVHNNKIKAYLENFDSLEISTIHGFCNRIINEYPFENKESFKRELVDDKTLYEKMLYKQMRELWHKFYGDYIDEMIELSDFTESPENFKNFILDVSLEYKPYRGDDLYPKPVLSYEIIKERLDVFNGLLKSLVDYIGAVDENNFYNHPLIVEYERMKQFIKYSKSVDTRITKILIPMLKFVINYKNGESIYKSFKSFYNDAIGCSGFNEYGYNILFIGELKSGINNINFNNEFQNTANIINLLDRIAKCYIILNKQLLTNTIDKLYYYVDDYKRDNNLISYDDMLKLVYNALDKKGNKLLSILQNKYKYALVDEFQDTDKIQWLIFKKIFLENKKNRLFIIGDPKQSIYGFRNADINTYISAKEEMKQQYNAMHYSLEVNWRSTTKLIDEFNNIFKDEWFKDDIDAYFKINIDYNKLNSSEKSNKLKFVSSDRIRNKTGINIFALKSHNVNDALKEYAGLILKEIKFLLYNENFILIDDVKRRINKGDIAIIVRKTREAEKIERFLRKNGIKSTIYKKSGLYQSNEAYQIKYLLMAIAYPENIMFFKNALLADFFNIPLIDLDSLIETDGLNNIRQLFEKWIKLSEKREWTLLFDSILYDTGVLYRKVFNEDDLEIDSERIVTNYKHIMENLSERAYKNRFDICDITEYLNNLINGVIKSDEDEDLHRLESEEEKIKIMTIHACKGLEFPIVFIYGSFGAGVNKGYYKIHNSENNITFDLIKSKKSKIIFDYESNMEDHRLYYVAFTRAVYKLYLPFYSLNKSNNIINIINKTICAAFTGLKNKIENYPNIINLFKPEDYNNAGNNYIFNEELFPEIDDRLFKNKKTTIQSFSSLNNKIVFELEDEVYNMGFDENEFDEDEFVVDNPMPDENSLPYGANVGKMFHKILEEIDFNIILNLNNYKALINNIECFEIIDKYMNIYLNNYKNFDNEKKCKYMDLTFNVIYYTLSTVIDYNENIVLSKIEKNDRLSEVEFYFPVDIGGSDCDIFINGFIDLIFRYNGKYYFLDWKSNYLENGYTGDSFYRDVKKHYRLQYEVYNIAFIEWLKSRIADFDYDKHFGGLFYIYLRGIGKDVEDTASGIFFTRPDIDEYNNIKNKLFSKIKNVILTV